MNTLNRLLFTKVDNSPLLIFRIFFGILVALECYGAILTGWVTDTLVDPQFTFNFIGFDWLQPLPGYGMYVYFFIMGSLGVGIAVGYKYRFNIIAFTLLWTGVYLMQKSSYNNHYYLLILISTILCFLPANANYALDIKNRPEHKREYMFAYVKWIIVLQLFFVYTYAAIAKVYGDWLDFSIIEILMSSKRGYYGIGELLQQPWIHRVIGVFGIVFDALIIPALLYKPTRKIAFAISVFFHLFNSIVFQIGIFPYLSLAFTVFFFEAETIQKIFFKKKAFYAENEVAIPTYRNAALLVASVYFLIQLILPLRHYFIKDAVLWTEEGHRMSWRMMLRSRTGMIKFKIVNTATQASTYVNLDAYLSRKQGRRIAAYPDFIWQFAQRLKKEYAAKGEHIAVYAENSKVSINGKPYRAFIDPKVDLANEPWNHWRHHEWILPATGDQ